MTITRKKKIALCMMVVLLLCATMMSVFAASLGTSFSFSVNMNLPQKVGSWSVTSAKNCAFLCYNITPLHSVYGALYESHWFGDKEVEKYFSASDNQPAMKYLPIDDYRATIIGYNPNGNTNGNVRLS